MPDAYEFVATNTGIDYFASQPRRLMLVMVIGVAGGIATLGLGRLSVKSQGRLKLATLATSSVLLILNIWFLPAITIGWHP